MTTSVIAVNNLVKHFGAIKAIDDISFEVQKGEVFGFLGPNGAGKSTTIRCIMDFIRPTSGSVTVFGKDSKKHGVEIKKEIGFLSGDVHLYDKWTGQEHINFIHKLQGVDDDISSDLIKKFDFDPTRKTKELSSGNKQKLGIIMSLMTKPDLIIMDEPTNALDPLLQNEIYKVLLEAAEQGATVFMSSHNLSEVDHVCTRVGIIKAGKMVATEEIMSLKRKRLYTARISFPQDASVVEIKGKGIEVLKKLDHTIEYKIKGDINQFVKLLTPHTLRDLEIEHASLEDIFLEYYQ